MKKIRYFTVQSKFQSRRWTNTIVPEIRIIGKWLEDAGFEKGEKIVLEQRKRKLIIRPCKEEFCTFGSDNDR